jgi:Tol biopolymer transport system component
MADAAARPAAALADRYRLERELGQGGDGDRVAAARYTRAMMRRVASGAAVGLIGTTLVGARAARAQDAGASLRFVGAARQMGPVGYRDPLGVVSPDGQWLAYTSGDWLHLVRLVGGPVSTLGPPARRLTALTWLPDAHHVAALEQDVQGRTAWWRFAVPDTTPHRLWNGPVRAITQAGDSVNVDPDRASQLAWSADGKQVAGTLRWPGGSALWTANADGSAGQLRTSTALLSFPTWSADGKTVACLAERSGHQRVSRPCGADPAPDARRAYGPIAFSPEGATLYYGSPNPGGTLDLWAAPTGGGAPTKLTHFSRDTYAPSVTRDGRVLFGTQDYRVFLAVVPAAGGPGRQLTEFQSETPSWSRDGKTIAFTFGTWRRAIDDFGYPNIAQDLGTIEVARAAPADRPTIVVRASPAEDQSLDWSPDERWIVLHSHADGLDDVWLQPADGSAPAHAITRGGHETGWPRWSPDGHSIAYGTEVREGDRWRGVLYELGIDPASGRVTREARRLPLMGFAGDVDQAEWLSADSLVFDAFEGLTGRAIYVVARAGGRPRLVHRFTSEQLYSGVGVARDARWVAFIQPAADGHFQVFRVSLSGGAPVQVTFDPTDKTQPAVSPDGKWIAFTVVSYQTLFWMMEPTTTAGRSF